MVSVSIALLHRIANCSHRQVRRIFRGFAAGAGGGPAGRPACGSGRRDGFGLHRSLASYRELLPPRSPKDFSWLGRPVRLSLNASDSSIAMKVSREGFMRLLQGKVAAAVALGLASMACGAAFAQAAPASGAAAGRAGQAPAASPPAPGASAASPQGVVLDPAEIRRVLDAKGCHPDNEPDPIWDEKFPCPSAPGDAAAAAPAKKIYTVPAGAKVLLQLRSGVDTRSAKPGDGVYLASTFPVVVGNRVLIPAGV